MPERDKSDLTLELLSAPIAGVDGHAPQSYGLIDPGELIDGHVQAVPDRDEQNNKEWAATVSFLIRALACGQEARSRAMLRIVQIALAGRFTAEEQKKLGAAIWDADGSGDGDLPGTKELRHWVYLRLPEPEPGFAETWFRAKWMSAHKLTELDDESLDNVLFHVSDAMEQSRQYGFSFELTKRDKEYLTGVLLQWAATPLPRIVIPAFEQERIDLMRKAIRGAARLLMHLDVPEDVAEALYRKHMQFGDSDVPAMPLLVGLVKSLKAPETEIHTALKKGFSSGDVRFVSNAAVAVQIWLDFAGRCMAPRLPSDLIREIGVIIATCRIDALDNALWVAEWVFAHGEHADREELRQLASEGLGSLIDVLDYGRELPKEADVPLLRWRCVGLARAMNERGCDDVAVMDWLAAAREDPLPEVRHRVSDILFKPEAGSAGQRL